MHFTRHPGNFVAHHTFSDGLFGIFFQQCIKHIGTTNAQHGIFQLTSHVVINSFAEGINIPILDTEGLDEGPIHFRKIKLFDFLDGCGKLRSFTSHIFTVIIFREMDVKSTFFPCFATSQPLFEIRQHLAVTDDEVHVFTAATIKGDIIDSANKIYGHAVTVFCSLIGFDKGTLLMAQGSNHVINIFIADSGMRQGNADAI